MKIDLAAMERDLDRIESELEVWSLELEPLEHELGMPDAEAGEIRGQIKATYQRDARGVAVLVLGEEPAISTRRALYAQLDENSHRWGRQRAARQRLRTICRRLNRDVKEAADDLVNTRFRVMNARLKAGAA